LNSFQNSSFGGLDSIPFRMEGKNGWITQELRIVDLILKIVKFNRDLTDWSLHRQKKVLLSDVISEGKTNIYEQTEFPAVLLFFYFHVNGSIGIVQKIDFAR